MRTFKEFLETPKQEFDSAKTSNPQIAATFRKIKWIPNTINLDYGGGKFDLATEFLKTQNVINLVYDPFNRQSEHNTSILNTLKTTKADTATCNNVLNVIKEETVRESILKNIAKLVKPNGLIYILIWEGNRSGNGGPTIKGWQNNLPTPAYLPEVRSVFGNVIRRSNLIIAQNRG